MRKHGSNRACPEDATLETLKILKEISSRCDTCQCIQAGAVGFRAFFGTENARFNKRKSAVKSEGFWIVRHSKSSSEEISLPMLIYFHADFFGIKSTEDGETAWLANTCPDYQFEVSQLAQITVESFDKDKPSLILCLKNPRSTQSTIELHSKFLP